MNKDKGKKNYGVEGDYKKGMWDKGERKERKIIVKKKEENGRKMDDWIERVKESIKEGR